MEIETYKSKVDMLVLLESIPTDQLRNIQNDIKEILKARAKKARKDAPKPKPEYRYWIGKITKRKGDVFGRYQFMVKPCNINEIPENLRDVVKLKYFKLMSGAFVKDTCPKVGDVVVLKYRMTKRYGDQNFQWSRITNIVPKTGELKIQI